MDSAADKIQSPLTPGRWQAQRGLGNVETLRQMLVYLEREYDLELKPDATQGRLINAELDRLLVEAFQRAKREEKSPLSTFQEALEQLAEAGELERLSPVTKSPEHTSADHAELVLEIRQEMRAVLQDFLAEQRLLAEQEREDQRQLWNKKWEHSLRKAEASFAQKLQEAEASYDLTLQQVSAKRQADAELLKQLDGSFTEMRSQVIRMKKLLEEREWEVSEAKEMNAQLEKLTQTTHTVVRQQQQAGLTLQKGLGETLNQAEKMRLLLPAQVSLGVVAGVMLTSLLHLAFPSKFQTIGNAMLLLSATIFMVAIWWWKKD
ncbi:hypothetical protein GCM10017783_21500 [Deinococcus piscis]|uniref:Uncharacterized protein n=1 Tax=Deinococcus piscis TaxID=394230 RepID=A0ABQ3KCK0_9DEIO|nr:hypothetical protein [Deinococcus piscis]GHG08638.1 hypothetical protein GCM10017783_21500 [Deinococcus piscis]